MTKFYWKVRVSVSVPEAKRKEIAKRLRDAGASNVESRPHQIAVVRKVPTRLASDSLSAAILTLSTLYDRWPLEMHHPGYHTVRTRIIEVEEGE